MSRYAIMRSTQIGVTLSLNIQVRNDNDAQLLTFNLVHLTTLFLWLWSIWQTLGRFRFEFSMLVNDMTNAVIFVGKIIVIGFSSLAYGMGVSL